MPSVIGVALFFLIPFIRLLYYSVINNQFQRKFVFLKNYIEVWKNEYFQLAIKNSIWMIICCVPALIILAIFISLMLVYHMDKNKNFCSAYIVPMVIPTASIVIIWRSLFKNVESELPIYLLFIWKNTGICIILLTAAFVSIKKEIVEAALIDGATWWKIQLMISIPLAAPTIVFCTLLSIMNSYKIFKESYLYYGTNYPPDYGYTLQYYMNNHFLKLNYQSLAAASVYITLFSGLIIIACIKMIRRVEE